MYVLECETGVVLSAQCFCQATKCMKICTLLNVCVNCDEGDNNNPSHFSNGIFFHKAMDPSAVLQYGNTPTAKSGSNSWSTGECYAHIIFCLDVGPVSSLSSRMPVERSVVSDYYICLATLSVLQVSALGLCLQRARQVKKVGHG